jgi:outer membrane protein OmpA-like peptidoglycan-associated protein
MTMRIRPRGFPVTMERIIGVVSILLLLTACTTPFWGQKQEQPQVRTEPLNDGELVSQLRGISLSAEEDPRGVVVNLNDLSFAPGKTSLTHKDRKTLRDLAKLLNDALVSDRPIAVEGHTDSIGAAAYNLELSKKRAQTVAQELIFNQIPAERITVIGYGEQHPAESNTNPDGSDNPTARAKNRRVEVIIGHREGEVPTRETQQ